MIGKRIYPGDDGTLPYLNPGEYAKASDGAWWLCVPTGLHGRINDKTWKITENKDGSITVNPSILITVPGHPKAKNYEWHGYLTKGVWKEC